MDIFPGRLHIGGAPLNVAAHLKALGHSVEFISSIGKDSYGEQIREFLVDRGLSQGLTIHNTLPTGRATVSTGEKDNQFAIDTTAAWTDLSPVKIPECEYLYFGSLAMHFEVNRPILQKIKEAGKNVFCFCDINLRPPHYSEETLFWCLTQADAVKVNEFELAEIGSLLNLKGGFEYLMNEILGMFHLNSLVCTRGNKSTLYQDSRIGLREFPLPALKSKNKMEADTVGAGDAFAALFLYCLMNHMADISVIMRQCQLFAGEICRIGGALPHLKTFYRKWLVA